MSTTITVTQRETFPKEVAAGLVSEGFQQWLVKQVGCRNWKTEFLTENGVTYREVVVFSQTVSVNDHLGIHATEETAKHEIAKVIALVHHTIPVWEALTAMGFLSDLRQLADIQRDVKGIKERHQGIEYGSEQRLQKLEETVGVVRRELFPYEQTNYDATVQHDRLREIENKVSILRQDQDAMKVQLTTYLARQAVAKSPKRKRGGK